MRSSAAAVPRAGSRAPTRRTQASAGQTFAQRTKPQCQLGTPGPWPGRPAGGALPRLRGLRRRSEHVYTNCATDDLMM